MALVLSVPLPFDGDVLAERIAATDWSAFLTASPDRIDGLDFLFEVEVTGPDPRMVINFDAYAEPVNRTVDEAELDWVATHEAVALVRSEQVSGADATLATAQRTQLVAVALIDAGALGVAVLNSRLSHSRERWRSLLAETRDAIQRQRAGERNATRDFFQGLLDTFVRRPVRTKDGWVHTRGMHLLARPEVAVRHDEVEDPLPILDAFMLHQTAFRHPVELVDGATFQHAEDGPTFTLQREPDPWHPADSEAHNVHGFWGLRRS